MVGATIWVQVLPAYEPAWFDGLDRGAVDGKDQGRLKGRIGVPGRVHGVVLDAAVDPAAERPLVVFVGGLDA